jgi:hypothetical protein
MTDYFTGVIYNLHDKERADFILEEDEVRSGNGWLSPILSSFSHRFRDDLVGWKSIKPFFF